MNNTVNFIKNNRKALLIVAACICVFVMAKLAMSIYNNSMPVYEDGKRVHNEVIKAADEIIVPIAERKGIDDLQLEQIDSDSIYGTDGVVCKYTSEKFLGLSDEEKFNLIFEANQAAKEVENPFGNIHFNDGVEKARLYYDEIEEYEIRGGSSKDDTEDRYYWISTNDSGYYTLKKYKEEVYVSSEINEEVRSYIRSDASSNDTRSNTKKTCSYCNGTGTVKYNYGESDLQAIFEGEDPYTMGPCPYCNGTGYDD